MNTTGTWTSALEEAKRWTNERFPHYARFISPAYSLEQYVSFIKIQLTDHLHTRDGIEVEAEMSGDSVDLLCINTKLCSSMSEQERIALVLHEIVEGYGLGSCLYHGMGFNIRRPEHDYAEFVEAHYRRDVGLSPCIYALAHDESVLMQRMDEFYKKFPLWRRYLGNALYSLLRKFPVCAIDESLRDEVCRECEHWR